MTFLRKRPWRPRSSWLGNRAGARRRGFRQDARSPAPDALPDEVDVVLAVASEVAPADDILLVEAVVQATTQSAVASRVDVSGLIAIASIAPEPVSLLRGDGAPPGASWRGQENEEPLLTRDSA